MVIFHEDESMGYVAEALPGPGYEFPPSDVDCHANLLP
jgi:hypothetical protein